LVGAQYQDNMLLELDKHRLNVIAYDGIRLGTLQELKQLLIAPGQRADVLVQAGGPGTYELNAMPFDQGHASPTGPLARVVVAGEPLPMALPAALPKQPLETIRDSEITGRRTLVLGATSPENDVAGHWQEFTFSVDGKIFDPARIDQRVRLGAVEEWTIRTPTSTTTICSTSTPTRSRSSKSAVSRRPIGRGGILWSCRGRPRAAASSCAHASSTTPASSCFTAT
jgi:FtsP/CotA-like multicopper oxidase with cupredoxin domain